MSKAVKIIRKLVKENKLTYYQIAKIIKKTTMSARNKVDGKTEFTIGEVEKILTVSGFGFDINKLED